MFGYVRPNRDELKVRELRDYEALYCGLCRALGTVSYTHLTLPTIA